MENGTEVKADVTNSMGQIIETITGKYQGYDGDGSAMILDNEGIVQYVAHYKVFEIKNKTKNVDIPELMKCDCGHSVPKISVMYTSTGSSCPDCYDRMSC